MNRVQIVQRLRQEAGVSGTGPAALANISGELLRLSNYADDAWMEIQGLALWGWRWGLVALNLAEGASTIAGARARRLYDTDTLRLASSTATIQFSRWEEFRDMVPSSLPVGTPSMWTVRPDKSLAFNAVAPAGGLAMTVEGFAPVAPLASDSEVPAMPAEYHMAIVWLALQKFAAFEEAGVLYQTAEREYRKVKARMDADELPQVELGGALC